MRSKSSKVYMIPEDGWIEEGAYKALWRDIMGEECKSEQVELQENGIVRNSNGTIIGRLITVELLDELKGHKKKLETVKKSLQDLLMHHMDYMDDDSFVATMEMEKARAALRSVEEED